MITHERIKALFLEQEDYLKCFTENLRLSVHVLESLNDFCQDLDDRPVDGDRLLALLDVGVSNARSAIDELESILRAAQEITKKGK
jgi:hypothetical protein